MVKVTAVLQDKYHGDRPDSRQTVSGDLLRVVPVAPDCQMSIDLSLRRESTAAEQA